MTLRVTFRAIIIATAALATSAASANTITFFGLSDPTERSFPLRRNTPKQGSVSLPSRVVSG
jgi:hypothetical protein